MWSDQVDSGYGGNQFSTPSGGGGFVSSPGFGSPQGFAPKRTRVNRTIPVTVADVVNANHEAGMFLIMNNTIEISQVCVIGIVRSVKEGASRIDYEIDDLTGPLLDVKQFVDNEEEPESSKIKPQRENTYVQVFGHVRNFGDKRNVVAFKIKPLRHLNGLTTHFLEVIHSRLVLREDLEKPAFPAASSNVGAGQSYDNRGGAGPSGMDVHGLTPLQQQVHMKIASAQSEQGISVQALCEQLSGLPHQQIRKAIEFLSSEGHIYSTIDDDHYKTTES